jgi:peptidylprolyl isomerase
VSSANRERRQRNRDARAAAVEDAQRRAVRQRMTFAIVGLALAAVVGIVLVVRATSNGSSSTSKPSTTSSSTTSTTIASVKGKPCVAAKGPMPKKTPTVPVQVGPPPKQLVIRDLAQGTGPAVKPGATVKMNYVLVACSSGKVIESSFATGHPITTPLDQVIPGWTEGIPGMRVGGVRLLGVPPALAYGAIGKGADIPPDETLWFVVKLAKIEK